MSGRILLLFCALAVWHAAAGPNDYSDPKTWLCRPGIHGPCDADMTATVVAADGKLTREAWRANPDAAIDCFYVYPTVSAEPSINSDMTPGDAEFNVIGQQFARFGAECRRFAPLYRQMTLAGLRAVLAGGEPLTDTAQSAALAYGDVLDAWNYYLEHDNQGRGFVLIGHSQGSTILRRLIRDEIDGRPLQSRMVSAILAGMDIAVPKGKDVGGIFKSVPLCRTAKQTGCVITYASFRAGSPPPPNTYFGRTRLPGTEAACVNPVELLGESSLHPYFSSAGHLIVGSTALKSWLTVEQNIETPWITLPDLFTAKCASNENGTYLEIALRSGLQGKRAGDIPGAVNRNGTRLPEWGLHLADMNLAMGDLVRLVGQQAEAYRTRHR
jgi:hypothetical protein